MLFFAFLLCHAAASVRELDAWASKVKLEIADAERLQAAWQPKGWATHNNVSVLYQPMEAAFKGVRDAESLSIIAAAMRFWDGPGRMDELDGKHLNNYMHRGLCVQ